MEGTIIKIDAKLSNLYIKNICYGGLGISSYNGQTVFVPYSAPHDRLTAKISKIKNDYLEAELLELEEPSPWRTTPPCPYFGMCGGCQLQHLEYKYQLQVKEDIIKDAFKRISKINEIPLKKIIPSPLQFGYRHKMEFSVRGSGNSHPVQIGLFRPNTHELVDIKECLIAHPLINKVLEKTKEILKGIPYYLNTLDISVNNSNQALLVLRFRRGKVEDGVELFNKIKKEIPGVMGGLIRIEQYKHALSMPWSDTEIPLNNLPYNYYFGPETFFQNNIKGNELLVKTVIETETFTGKEAILELHCGIGNFSLPLASKVKRLVGIESNPDSVDKAIKNASLNNISNLEFIKKSDLKGLKYILNSQERFDLLVLDPPRCGCKHIMEYIPSLDVKKIIYVSCNPTTLARDVSMLIDKGYQLASIQPIDMFPQTHHVESVVFLER
ncbi:MAG: 23S rRNA (uracil(1939)-C(5))-methyltransferase RlmD [bacterium]